VAVPDVTLDDAGLPVLVDALEREARLHDTGRMLTERFLGRLGEVRAQLAAHVRRDPGVRAVEIRAPLFVTGAPRTGTTLLFALLAEDPSLRAPLGWELLYPVPAPIGADDATRIALAERELRGLAEATGGALDAIHEYGARLPKECLSAMSLVYRSEEFTARYSVPSYVEWLQACDMRPAYEVHHLVLQLLQGAAGAGAGRTWVLKSPVHLHSLGALLAVYPDARIVVTHRDPAEVLGSVNSLVATLRSAHSDHVDMDDIARYHADLYGRSLDALVDFPDDRLRHVRYVDLAADPLGVVRTLYADLDLPLAAEVEARMQAYVDRQPRPSHAYAAAPAGDARFARYRERFGV
jgi:hypothetical protein